MLIYPTPNIIKSARLAANLTQREAAYIVKRTIRNWQQWEYGERKMSPALFEYFIYMLDNIGFVMSPSNKDQ